MGSSDKKAFNSHAILANAYDEKLSYLTNGSELQLVEKEGDMIRQDSYNLVLKMKAIAQLIAFTKMVELML